MVEYTILEQVKIRLNQFETQVDENGDSYGIVFTNAERNPILEQLIHKARKDVEIKRNYPSHYTKEMISQDLNNYDSVIVDIVLYDYAKIGGDYQSSFTENGIQRIWVNRDSLFEGVIPFVHIL